MIRIAIVEDSRPDAQRIQEFLEQWSASEGQQVELALYASAWALLTDFHCQFQIILLDILLPDKNGVDVAKILRKQDETVAIVFTTNMKQYAINGYEVDALDFLLKPIHYSRLVLLMKKCMSRICHNQASVVLRLPGSTYQVPVEQILYLESNGHSIILHLYDGQTLKKRMTLAQAEPLLPPGRFARCNVSYLVNLSWVKAIEGDYVAIGQEKLKLTRSKNREFRKAFVEFYAR